MNQAADKKCITLEGYSNSRRRLLRQLLGVSAGLPISRLFAMASASPQDAQHHTQQQHTSPAPPSTLPASISAADDQFLNQLEQANFLFFWEQANPQTGLIKDRCNVRTNDTSLSASIASTGFGLTAICIGEKRGFISYPMARLRVVQTLSFLWHKLPTHRGFFYHFANINTGERIWDSEVSSVDTAILLCGVLTCRQHFQDKDIDELAHAIFDRVEWNWLSEDTSLLSMGWTTGIRIHSVAVGSLQRVDDDVPARNGLSDLSAPKRRMVGLETDDL